ncbi:unnamed protein product [Cylindrotheca closterium]|uniref:RNA helicase n=1 Tax=Cylindrotheca closterium TaxID=2856 RepID=A0AAD2CBB4_9STRA|nr:unnamed protein product [Cylindrotheca closterium]
MRRSKSDPAKYARNYRKISQRRMTQYDHIDEESEMTRLRSILRNSEKTTDLVEQAEEETSSSQGKRKRKSNKLTKADEPEDMQSSILSNDLLLESGDYGAENPLVVLPKKKKKKKESKKIIQLTPEEIREAKILQKKTARKLQQLETRAAQKIKRAELYKTLQEHQLSKEKLDMLSSSGTVSRKNVSTKKQTLQHLIKRERAGLVLNEKEKSILYKTKDVDEDDMEMDSNTLEQAAAATTTTKPRNKKSKTQERKFRGLDGVPAANELEPENDKIDDPVDEVISTEEAVDDPNKESKEGSKDVTKEEEDKAAKEADAPSIGFNFAAQMMASLSKLKAENDNNPAEEAEPNDLDTLANSAEPSKRYVVSEPTVLKTAAAMRIKGSSMESKRRVVQIKRPSSVEKARYDLPVSTMEYEIMDSIRNNDVTIVCGETGSGKSTQVPQFLYEGGLCLNPNDPDSQYLIGVTQPRRVAAVSTAKRVCYEVGKGDGQTIKNQGKRGNLVSYKTRYESAGAGSDTAIQFMTDGILLQEIQEDLLLRKYSVIVLDEAHERNLNTDVLIGLLSKTIPLRRQAAEESSDLVPLKLVLMSATLRVEDFTKNVSLFPSCKPFVVKVPGRTFPVSIHHSKVTEIDDYQNAAFKKICKIHRKLPQGGILVFLTGKHEILRMVKRLRKVLGSSTDIQGKTNSNRAEVDKSILKSNNEGIPRELDDEDFDADEGAADDYDEYANDEEDVVAPVESDDDNIPKNAYVLPLYSLLSPEEQAKIFAPVPENNRLIVISTNIAETSITIPGISYVVDTGRQKCRNYSSGTGIASYEVMWISKAAADQRAGRAGRTGPGHCYRLYSSSLYSRHMDSFALPEILTRPLEDVILAMKALNVSHVSNFPFPTPPDRSQVNGALKLLSGLGCVDMSDVETVGGDGNVTKLGQAVAKLPLGVRYAKMLLVAAHAGVLDYAIVVVSILSESSPFYHASQEEDKDEDGEEDGDDDSLDDVDRHHEEKQALSKKREKLRRWNHKHGDIMAAMLAVGAFTYAGRDAGGQSEKLACKRFCEENGLDYVIMTRIQKMRAHLASLAKNRLSAAGGVAARTGGFVSKMKPPSKNEELFLVQSIVSGLLDNVALLAPPGSMSGEHKFGLRSAYLSSSAAIKQPMFIDRNSTVYSRDYRQLPQFVCYDSLISKTNKDGTPVVLMKNVTPLDSNWLGDLAKGSNLLSLGEPLSSPPPTYDAGKDAIICSVVTKFGSRGWEIPPAKRVMSEVLSRTEVRRGADFLADDSFRWFAKFLLEGKVIPQLEPLKDLFSDNPVVITQRRPMVKVTMLVKALTEARVDSAFALKQHWAEKDDKFLFKALKHWVKKEHHSTAKSIWIKTVKTSIKSWKSES